MNSQTWIVLVIVAAAAFFLGFRLFSGRQKDCCKNKKDDEKSS